MSPGDQLPHALLLGQHLPGARPGLAHVAARHGHALHPGRSRGSAAARRDRVSGFTEI